jgi:hypothetical protein
MYSDKVEKVNEGLFDISEMPIIYMDYGVIPNQGSFWHVARYGDMVFLEAGE